MSIEKLPVEKPPVHTLVIDDDARLQDGVRDYLEPYGYKISALPGGENIEAGLKALQPDIILLDVMLPGEDGFSVLRRLRNLSQVPVIMVSARSEDIDRILGLELGADDYIAKPFNPRELLARMKAVLRRAPTEKEARKEPVPDKPAGLITTGSVTLDCTCQTLKIRDREKALSTAEFAIIRVFMEHAGEVLSRDDIINLAFGNDYHVNDRSIDVHITRLRKLLRSLGDDGVRILTVWGRGYRWIAKG
ncbi:MAG: response regulator [Desulfovibrionaceae bacterium]|nr:response regulator [Desulfovibrionaceae bacterium]